MSEEAKKIFLALFLCVFCSLFIGFIACFTWAHFAEKKRKKAREERDAKNRTSAAEYARCKKKLQKIEQMKRASDGKT
jgi:hypothetical protein